MRGPQLAWLSQQTGLLSYRQLAALGDAAHADRMHELLASNAEGALAIAGNWLAAMTGTDGKDPAAIPQIAVQEMHTVQGSTLALLPASWFAHFSPLQILALSSQQLQHVQADQVRTAWCIRMWRIKFACRLAVICSPTVLPNRMTMDLSFSGLCSQTAGETTVLDTYVRKVAFLKRVWMYAAHGSSKRLHRGGSALQPALQDAGAAQVSISRRLDDLAKQELCGT